MEMWFWMGIKEKDTETQRLHQSISSTQLSFIIQSSKLSSESFGTANPAHRMFARSLCRTRRQHAIPPISLLVNRYIVRQSAQQIEFPFDPAKDLLGRCQELEIPKSEQIAN